MGLLPTGAVAAGAVAGAVPDGQAAAPGAAHAPRKPLPASPRIAVAMCTYNGAAYVREQLESIAAQSRLPDEVVVVDDGSTDGTVESVRSFAETAPVAVRVIRNDETLGFIKNFEKAIRLAEGDVIALADQDDVWPAGKLRAIESAFRDDPAIDLVFSDADLVDQDLRPLGCRLWESVRFTPDRQREAEAGRLFETLLRGNVVTGATCAFRVGLRDAVLPIESEEAHDSWIALIAAATAGTRGLSEPLLLYRQHGGNQIGAERKGPLERLRAARRRGQDDFGARAAELRAVRRRLASHSAVSRDRLLALDEAIRHLDARVRVGELGRLARLPLILRELARGCYAAAGEGWKSAARDLMIRPKRSLESRTPISER